METTASIATENTWAVTYSKLQAALQMHFIQAKCIHKVLTSSRRSGCIPLQQLFGCLRVLMQYAVVERRPAVWVGPIPSGSVLQQVLYQ